MLSPFPRYFVGSIKHEATDIAAGVAVQIIAVAVHIASRCISPQISGECFNRFGLRWIVPHIFDDFAKFQLKNIFEFLFSAVSGKA